jgi:hypothetical protein
METVKCIKSVRTSSGLQFEKGTHYKYTINQSAIRIYIDNVSSFVISDERVFNKYFK